MERFYAEIFGKFSFGLGCLSLIEIDHPFMQLTAQESADKWKPDVRERILSIRTWLEDGLPMSLKYIDETYLPALDDPLTLGRLSALCRTLEQRIRDELSLQVFVNIHADRAKYYLHPRKEWADGIARFPSIAVDAEESSKCYALERYTASVFHMMRVLEVPLAAIARELGVVKHSPTWNAYLEAFKDKTTAKFPAATGADRRMRDYYAGLEAQLRAIKDAFRNPTMHSLERTYTQEMAHEVFVLLRGFLREAGKELKE